MMKSWKIIMYGIVLSLTAAAVGCSYESGDIVSESEEKIVLSVLAGQSTSDAGIEEMIDDVVAQRDDAVFTTQKCATVFSFFVLFKRQRFHYNEPIRKRRKYYEKKISDKSVGHRQHVSGNAGRMWKWQ